MSRPELLPELSTVAQLRRAGGSPAALERAALSGDMIRVRRGAYVESNGWRGQRADGRHRLLVAAAQAAALSPIVFSHESAAAILGIPLIGAWPVVPQATSTPGRPRRSSSAIAWHTSPLNDDVVERSGYLLTSPLRTAIDLSAARSFVSGVVSLDHVLRGGVPKEQVLERIAETRPFRGVLRVEAIAQLATGLAESPVESLSLVRMWEGGYPLPEQQRRYVGPNGEEYFPDFCWPKVDALGEADGRGKYEDGEFLRGRTPEQALWDEKWREDELRAQCSAFVRWSWDDAWQGRPLFRKLERVGLRSSRR